MDEPMDILYNCLNAMLRMQQVVRQRIQQIFEACGYDGMTLEMAQVLYFLKLHAGNENLNQQMMADKLGKSKSSITSLMDNLVKRNMVKRWENPASRRNNAISLSKQGEIFVNDIYPAINKVCLDEKVMLSETEFNLLAEKMRRLISARNHTDFNASL